MKRNLAREILSRVVNRAIAGGAPVFMEMPAPHVKPAAPVNRKKERGRNV
jgi:hypothetical protein